jgi:DUF1365 family protein
LSLLCIPRLFGYGFNPLSVYFCYLVDGALAAILCEVHNAFGERHAYLIAVDQAAERVAVTIGAADKDGPMPVAAPAAPVTIVNSASRLP